MKRPAGGLTFAVLAALGAAGCGSGSDDAALLPVGGSVQVGLANDALYRRVPIAPFDTRHRGVRLVEAWDWTTEKALYVAYLEEITTDGESGYSIVPLETLTNTDPPEPLFLLQQQSREGFVFRYRDFSIRNEPLFFRNYVFRQEPAGTTVAGRPCAVYVVEPQGTAAGSSFEIAIDVATGLVLRSIERDHRGRNVARVSYESFEEDPVLGGEFVPHVPSNDETPLPLDDFAGAVGFEPLVPRLLPEGFVLQEAASVRVGGGAPWLKLTYVDGVQTLLFLQGYPPTDAGPDQAGPVMQGIQAPQAGRVLVHRTGNVVFASGFVDGYRLIAIGKTGETELLDMLESALP